MIDLPTSTLLAAAAIVTLGYVVYGLTGFGSSIVAVPLLAQHIDNGVWDWVVTAGVGGKGTVATKDSSTRQAEAAVQSSKKAGVDVSYSFENYSLVGAFEAGHGIDEPGKFVLDVRPHPPIRGDGQDRGAGES